METSVAMSANDCDTNPIWSLVTWCLDSHYSKMDLKNKTDLNIKAYSVNKAFEKKS
jgi:hypothetical protein